MVVPVFNVADWIEEFLFSLEQQSLADFEAIIVDDGSTDGTLEVVERHASDDDRFQLHRNPGKGGGAARNFGVSIASGAYLAFADGDDVVPQHAFAAMVDDLARTGSDMAVLDHLTFSTTHTGRRNDDLGIYGAQRTGIRLSDEPLLLRDRVCWKKAFRLDWWRANDIEFSDSARSNDIFAMVQAYAAADRIDIVPAVGYSYRRRPGRGSMSSQAHALRSLRDHFREELKCYQRLNGALTDDARVVYFENLLTWDIFAHLQGLVGQPLTQETLEMRSEVAEAARYLFSEAPRAAIERLPENRRQLYRLLGNSGPGELLRFWTGGERPAASQALADLRDPQTAETLRRFSREFDGEAQNRIRLVVREYFLQTILHRWDEFSTADRAEALAAFKKLATGLIPHDDLEQRERHLFARLNDVDPSLPDWLRTVLAAGKLKVSAFRDRGRAVRIEVMLGSPSTALPDVVLTGRDGTEHVLPLERHNAKTGSRSVTPKTLGSFGTWDVAVRWSVDGHTVTETAYAMHTDPVARIDPIKAVPSPGPTPIAIRVDTPARLARLAAGGFYRQGQRLSRAVRRRAGSVADRLRLIASPQRDDLR